VSSVVDEVSSGPKPALGFLASPAARSLIGGLTAAAAWLAVAVFIAYWPDRPESDWAYTDDLAVLCGALAIALALAALAGVWFAGLQSLRQLGPWLVALALFLVAWETVTAKLGLLPLPFFPPPQAILEVVIDDRARLGACIFASFRLLATGYFLGAAVGFVTGVAIGWSRLANYWIHPILRFIGPLPATAWLPLAFFIFPSSYSASIFLIALATGFPVTVLTWSGVAGVNIGCEPALPGAQSGHSCGNAACLCRPVHGPRHFVRGSRCCGNAGRKGGSRLVPAMGAGLGRLR